MRNTLILFGILLLSFQLFAQKSRIVLLNETEYKLDPTIWEVEENEIINTPYHFEYILSNKKRISKMRVRISVMDYYLKDSVYSDLEIEKKTAIGELEDLREELLEYENENVSIQYTYPEDYKGFKIMTVEMNVINDNTKNGYFSIGVKVLDDYLVIGASVENLVNSSAKESESLLKCHLKRITKSK